MDKFHCLYLHGDVELTSEREQHIVEHHPDLFPEHRELILNTLASPDEVRQSSRFGNARLFSRWYANLREGKHVVVIVVSEFVATERHWIVTAYIARKLVGGVIEWQRN